MKLSLKFSFNGNELSALSLSYHCEFKLFQWLRPLCPVVSHKSDGKALLASFWNFIWIHSQRRTLSLRHPHFIHHHSEAWNSNTNVHLLILYILPSSCIIDFFFFFLKKKKVHQYYLLLVLAAFVYYMQLLGLCFHVEVNISNVRRNIHFRSWGSKVVNGCL